AGHHGAAALGYKGLAGALGSAGTVAGKAALPVAITVAAGGVGLCAVAKARDTAKTTERLDSLRKEQMLEGVRRDTYGARAVGVWIPKPDGVGRIQLRTNNVAAELIQNYRQAVAKGDVKRARIILKLIEKADQP